MNILIFVKQVPKEDMKLDPVSKTLIRSAGSGTISEYDKYAVEMALRLKTEYGGKVYAVTMGPPQSAEVLRYCLSLGVDDVFLLSDRKMGGADAYATVNALTAAVRYLEDRGETFDLYLCGKQASDSDTSLVMPQLAEAMGLPQLSCVYDYDTREGILCFHRETDQGSEQVQLALPAVLSLGKTAFPLRYPNIKRKLAANRRQITALDAEVLDINEELLGVKGSKTSVGTSYFPENRKACKTIMAESHEETAAALLAELCAAKLI